MNPLRIIFLATILLASLGLTACSGSTDVAGSASDAEQASKGGADGELVWPVDSARAILDAIENFEDDSINMAMLDEIASKQDLKAEVEELDGFLQRIASGDLGSGRTGSEALVTVATGITQGRTVPTPDLRDALREIIETK